MLTRGGDGEARLGGLRLGDLFTGTHTDTDTATATDTGAIRTPAYVYDLDGMAAAARALRAGFGAQRHLVAYAVKANSAGAVLRTLREAGCGAEVVSGSELDLVLRCGFAPDDVLYSGVGKRAAELDRAIGVGERGIRAVQMESIEEIGRVAARARALGRVARVSIRINPGVTADTHAHIATGHDEAKFGIGVGDLGRAWEALGAAPEVRLVGLSCHVGSQLTRTDEYLRAGDVILDVAQAREALTGPLEFVDPGGGFGVDYGDARGEGAERASGGRGTSEGGGAPAARATPADFAAAIAARLSTRGLSERLAVVEPGRSLVAPFGVLCATVIAAKRTHGRSWLVIDAGMNDLLRPALYGARHRIEPMDAAPPAGGAAVGWRVAGPVCESSDDFGEHALGEAPPERVVVRDAGAYGYVMASEYNGRALPCEVFLRGGEVAGVSNTRSEAAWIAERIAAGA
ncbi:MAG: diaminopimelate decarboxylase [Polyangiaceae bacterium]